MTRAEPPFFVVGNPRSWTKMLRELLNASPDLWISDIESHFIPRFTRRIGEYDDLAERDNFRRLTDDLRRTRAFWYWKKRGILIDTYRWYDYCQSFSWPGVLEGLFRCVHEQEIRHPPKPWNEVIWGDKTPAYMAELPLLAELFPRARFIHIIRDPRDCCMSAQNTWGNSTLRTAQEWADRVRACREAGQALGPERYFELQYEDLVRSVKKGIGRAFAFLGVPTPPDAGRLLRVPENLGAAKGKRKVVARNVKKWKTSMPPRTRRRIERLTGTLLDDLGYEREFPDLPTRRLSSARMTLYRLVDAWRQMAFRRREQGGWLGALRFLRAR